MSKKSPSNGTRDKAAEKRAAVLGTEKKKKSIPLVAVAAILAVLAIGAYFVLGSRSQVSTAEAAPLSGQNSKSVSIPAAGFDDMKAKFYSYDDGNGPAVRYYAVKGTDGRIHTAYDACDACWAEGKGYKQNGDVMVCQNCRRLFTINKIGEIHGGCNPGPLASRVENGNLVIDVADIVAGRHYFDLPKRD